MNKQGHTTPGMPGNEMAPAPEQVSAWLEHLSAREIAWLIVRLGEFASAHTWISPEKAECRIRVLRDELRARGELDPA